MDIYVYECFSSSESRFMGTLFVDTAKRNEHYSFEYAFIDRALRPFESLQTIR